MSTNANFHNGWWCIWNVCDVRVCECGLLDEEAFRCIIIIGLDEKIGTVVSCSCARFVVVYAVWFRAIVSSTGLQRLVCQFHSSSCASVWLLTKPINKHVQPVKSDTKLFTLAAPPFACNLVVCWRWLWWLVIRHNAHTEHTMLCACGCLSAAVEPVACGKGRPAIGKKTLAVRHKSRQTHNDKWDTSCG